MVGLWQHDHKILVQALANKHGIKEDCIHLVDQHPRAAITQVAGSIQADLVVLGVVSRRRFKHLAIGRNAEYVLDHLDCDVLTAIPQPEDLSI